MRFYRCKCGEHQAYGSDSPSRCSACAKCGSDLAESPSLHREPVPHEFYAETVETNGGTQELDRCKYCHRTRKQIWPTGAESVDAAAVLALLRVEHPHTIQSIGSHFAYQRERLQLNQADERWVAYVTRARRLVEELARDGAVYVNDRELVWHGGRIDRVGGPR